MPGTKKAFTDKQKRFIDEYLIDCNATQAAIRAGYAKKAAVQTGYELLQKDHVQEEIARRRVKISDMADVQAVDVIRGLARVAMMDPRKLFTDSGEPIGISNLDDDTAMAVAGVEVATVGNQEIGLGQVTKLKLNDRVAAMDKLMKHLGQYERDNSQRAIAGAGYEEIASALKRRLQAEGLSMKDLIDAGND